MRSSIFSPHFPPGKQLVLSWSIPDPFGGMTGALMHRSRAFVRLANRPVDILTLDDRLDLPELAQRLRRTGELIDGIRIFNIWDWLREHDVAAGTKPPKHTHTPLRADTDVRDSRSAAGVVLREVYDSDGSVSAVDRFRSDGSLLVTDRKDVQTQKRTVILYDRDGAPARSWGSVWGIYRYWLDEMTAGEQSFLVVDSKTAARFAHTYRRPHVVTMHVLHGSHRTADGSALSRSRRTVLENLSDFDSAVLLTRGQRDDVIRDLGPQPNLAVIPNGFDGTSSVGAEAAVRVRGRGVMLASLIARKRVSHAIKAVAGARRLVDVTLDVYGEGERRPLLEKTIRSQGVDDHVRLRGHDTEARASFASADFMLLTSKAEGLPLALVEGMAAGCIPIAYDIPYGPADVISDGRNGFLVPPGDVEAMAQRIVEVQRMSPQAVEAMRRRARATAGRFHDRAVVRAWGREMERAFERKHAAKGPEPIGRRMRHVAGRAKRRLTRLSGYHD